MRLLFVITLLTYSQAFIQIGRGVRPEDLLISSKTKTTMADLTTTEGSTSSEILTTTTLTETTETTTEEPTTEVELFTTTESEQTSTVQEEVTTETSTEAETTDDIVTTVERSVNNTTTEESTQTEATTTITTTETTTTTTEGGKCQDQFSRCHGVRNLCQNTLYRKIMTTVCAKTCGFCHQFVRLPMPERCIDHHPKECQIWGDNGFCHAYFYTMPEKVENCMKTCGLC